MKRYALTAVGESMGVTIEVKALGEYAAAVG